MKVEMIKNSLNDLGNVLIDIIKSRKDLFSPITVVVPNSKIGQWFKTYWLKSESDILMNVNFVNIDKALLDLIDTDEPYKLLKKETIKSYLIKILSSDNNINIPLDIKNYLYDGNITKQSIKIYDVCEQLSQLYIEYENDQVNYDGWEKELFEKVLEGTKEYYLSTLSELFNKFKKCKINNQALYFFGFVSFTKLQIKIIDEYAKNSNIQMLCLKNDNYKNTAFKVTAAPSKLREIEAMHSKICKLLQDKNNKYSDFLVLAPDISVYEEAIIRVFNQDNKNFPNIPYVINDKKKTETNVSTGLNKLYEIFNKKFYTRLDFFELINNQDIQNARGITMEDVKNWGESIVSMNVYRNTESCDDWEYAKMRVLLSKVANVCNIDENIIDVNNTQYIPYSNIGFTDESIIKFVSLIDDLKIWINLLSNNKTINNDNILLIKNELDKWFSVKDKNGYETNKYYYSITSIINTWYSMNIVKDGISLDLLFYSLLDESKVTKFSFNDYFVRGITFSDFDSKAVLSAKHIFFLNASSRELPKKKVKSELDVRTELTDELKIIKDAFMLQYQNAGENFFISYVNKNLKTDEDFYPSSFILELKNDEKYEDDEIISLDEKRPWTELFTKKQYKNKDYYLGLLSLESYDSKNAKIYEDNGPMKKVTIKNMERFLMEPLQFKAKQLFGSDDLLEEKMKSEYEPFELNNLTLAGVSKTVIVDRLVNGVFNVTNEYKQNLKRRLNLNHQLPTINEIVNDDTFNEVMEISDECVGCVKKYVEGQYDVLKLKDLEFNNNDIQWKLVCDSEICINQNGNQIQYFQMKKLGDSDRESDYLYLYVASLMHIASLPEGDYIAKLYRKGARDYNITPSKAMKILQSIYDLMNDYENNLCLPLKYVIDQPNTFFDFIYKMRVSGNPWEYFNDSNLFDYDTQLGYIDNEDYTKKFKEASNVVKSLLKFYVEPEKEESDE